MRVAIIGAGLSGLTFGAQAARDGYEVVVFDKNKKPGGVVALCEVDSPVGRFGFEQGPLILTDFLPDDTMYNFLSGLGIHLPMVRADRGIATPDFGLWHPDEYAGPDWRKEELKRLFPEDAAGIDEYYRFYDALMHIRYLSLQKQTPLVKLRTALTFLKIKKYADMSAQEFVDTLFTKDKLKIVFIGIFADFCADPSEVSALMIPFVNIETAFDKRIPLEKHGKLYYAGFANFEGGCQKLPEALAAYICEHGGSLRMETVVSRVRIESGAVRGVELENGEFVEADIVVGCGAAKDFFEKTVGLDYLDDAYRKILCEFRPMEAVFMLHLGVDFDPSPYQKEPLCYYYGTYDLHEATEKLRTGAYHGGDDGYLIVFDDAHAPSLAPAGYHCITIYTVAPDRLIEDGKPVSWEVRKEKYAARLIALAERQIPELGAHIVAKKIMTAEDYRVMTHMEKSSFGGVVPIKGQQNPPHKTPIDRLWFLGQQSENAGGVSAVMQGAIAAYKEMERSWPRR